MFFFIILFFPQEVMRYMYVLCYREAKHCRIQKVSSRQFDGFPTLSEL